MFLPWVVWKGTTSKKLFSKHLPMLAEGQHFCLLMKVVGVGQRQLASVCVGWRRSVSVSVGQRRSELAAYDMATCQKLIQPRARDAHRNDGPPNSH